MNQRLVRILALVGVLGVAACGGDDPAAVGDQLSDIEAQDLAFVLLGAAFDTGLDGGSFVPAMVDGPAAAPFSIQGSVDDTAPCPQGGTVSVAGSISATGDDATGALNLTFDVNTSHSGCGVPGESMDFVLSSQLRTMFSLNTSGAGDISWSGDVDGSVDWTGDNRSGTCTVDYSFDGDLVAETELTVTLTGTVCGTSINREFTYTAG